MISPTKAASRVRRALAAAAKAGVQISLSTPGAIPSFGAVI